MARSEERCSDFIKWLKVVVGCGSKVKFTISYENTWIVTYIEWPDLINVYTHVLKLFIKQ